MVSELAGKNFPNSVHVIHYIQIKFGKVSLLIVACRREIKLRIEIQKGGSPHHSAHWSLARPNPNTMAKLWTTYTVIYLRMEVKRESDQPTHLMMFLGLLTVT
jgi:hypothetical protein